MKNISATYKGLITGILMVLVSIAIYAYKKSFENSFQYITYCIYIAGIIWTLNDFKRSSVENKSFKNYFSQGFRCFIVVTLLMVAFTFVFLQLNPDLKEQMAQNYKEGLQKQKNYTPAEIDAMVVKAKDYFVTMLTSMTIFGYLLIGALVTLIASAIFSQKKR